MSEWISLLGSGQFVEAVLAACQFGSPHQKEFCFRLYLVLAIDVEKKCTCDHPHLRIEGKFTKQSAVYLPAIGEHLAIVLQKVLRRQVLEIEPSWSVAGLESVVVNDLAETSSWEEDTAWFWRKPSHFKVSEVASAVRILEKRGPGIPHTRLLSLLDSAVARGALLKGRSTSRVLQPWLKRAAVLQVSHDLYPVWPFYPTRLNVADATDLDFRNLHRTGLKRAAENWISLLVLGVLARETSATPVVPLDFADHAEAGLLDLSGLFPLVRFLDLWLSRWGSVWISTCAHVLACLFFLLPALACLLRGSWRLVSWICLVIVLASPAHQIPGPGLLLCAEAMEPSSAAERTRAAARASTTLTGDRVALDFTRNRRKKLLKQFQSWLWQSKGVSLIFLLKEKPADPEKIANWLVLYGQELYKSGKAYGIFAETINSVAASRPQIRKQLTVAWDYAFSWVADEPFGHHPALPALVLLAMMAVGLIWGWVCEAAIFGLTWAGILRIGEVLQATREDLVLPRDAAPGTPYALLRIKEPKTRGRHARHQAARVDPTDIIELLDIAFAKFDPGSKLWSLSASTLRKRFNDLLRAVRIPLDRNGKSRTFDLSSLRPGGASHLLTCCEDSEVVRRRGRWATVKTMEIYLQEVLYVTYVERLPADTKSFIATAAAGFQDVLQKAKFFTKAGIPTSAWYFLLRGRQGATGGDGQNDAAFDATEHCSRELPHQHGKARETNLFSSLGPSAHVGAQGSHPT